MAANTFSAEAARGGQPEADMSEQTGRGRRTFQQRLEIHPLVVVAAAVGAGMSLDLLGWFPAWAWAVLAMGLWLAWLCLLWLHKLAPASWLLALQALALGGFWHHARFSVFPAQDLGLMAQVYSGPVALQAEVLQGPRVFPPAPYDPLAPAQNEERSLLVIRVRHIRDGTTFKPAGGQATVVVPGRLRGVRPGDLVQVLAKLKLYRPQQNPLDFDSARYHRSQRELCYLQAEDPTCITRLARGSPWNVRHRLGQLRQATTAALTQHVPAPQNELARALLLGDRGSFDQGRLEPYLVTGTVHILAISGMHLGMLAWLLFFILRIRWIPAGPGLLTIAVLCMLYALVTDSRPPIVRATVLVLVVCLAMYWQRRVLSFNALAASLLVVLAMNPCDLFQTGAQLSFLAVAALAVSTRLLPQALRGSHAHADGTTPHSWRSFFKEPCQKLGHMLGVSTAVWALTVPLVALRYHVFSPVAVVLNPLLVLPVSTALCSGFVTLVAGPLHPGVAGLSGKVCGFSLDCMERLVHWGEQLPGAYFWLSTPGLIWLCVTYAGSVLVVQAVRVRPWQRNIWVLSWAAWVAAGLFIPAPRGNPDEISGQVISVGHGTSVFMRLPSGQTVLYDAGQMGSPHRAAQSISGVLWSEGVHKLDIVCISHADVDHFNALPQLLKRFKVNLVLAPPGLFTSSGAAVGVLRKSLAESGVRVRIIAAGESWPVDAETTLRVLHPPPEGVPGKDNAKSLVLCVQWQDFRLLLPGDLEGEGLKRLLKLQPIDCDLALAPHHGSLNSNPRGFFSWCTPEAVIVSGNAPRDGAAVALPAEMQAQLWHTAIHGAVRFRAEPGHFSAEPVFPGAGTIAMEDEL